MCIFGINYTCCLSDYFGCNMVHAVFRSLIMAKITIETNKGIIEYYQVPGKLAKAIVRILDYTISGTEIVSCESDSEDC